jgi:hypothetical protein
MLQGRVRLRFADSSLLPLHQNVTELLLLLFSFGRFGSDALHSFVLQHRPLFPVPSTAIIALPPASPVFPPSHLSQNITIRKPKSNLTETPTSPLSKSIEHQVFQSLPRPPSWLVSKIQRSGGASHWPSTLRKKSQTSLTTLQRLRAHLGFS